MAAKKNGKKLLKIAGISLVILFVLLTGFHFWFKAHAKELIEDIVDSRSNGKLKLKIGKFHFGYFSKKMELENAVFYSTDSTNAYTSYSFNVKKIKLEVQALLPILFSKSLLIDSLTLVDPDIKVTRLKVSPSDTTKSKKDVSIPEEMGKVYHSIQDALQVLKVTRFHIDNGKFMLINKIQPDAIPMVITNINFQIDNFKVDADKSLTKEKILFSDNVMLNCYNQDILFPDGRHRLSFSNFRINLRKKIVEFDSCTIAATRTDSSSSSFRVFFDSLFLTNINFDTLYRHEVIKADSVYCINPKFNLDVEVNKKKTGTKSSPKLENIIKQLTGDLQLGYVIVSNADFNIKTMKDDNPSSFTFSQNSFEMQGLSIDQGAAKPIKVKSFVMAIRNYENFIKDSSYRLQFDSILFRDDRIYLSNFIFHKLDNNRITNSFNIPQLYLSGLSWDELVFDNKLKARQATLFNPSINYTVSDKQRTKAGGRSIFQSISAINDYVDLEYLDIVEGNINLKIKNDLRFQLDKATLSIQSHALLSSKELSGVKNSLNNLNFENGIIHAGNLTLGLKNIRYIGNTGQFDADNISVTDNLKNTDISAQNVSVEKMLINEKTGDILADNIKWQKANVKINIAESKKENSGPVISLKNVQGLNSTFNAAWNNKVISTKINNVSFDLLEKKPGNKLIISGFAANGGSLKMKDAKTDFSITDYQFSDNKKTFFQQVTYKASTGKINADISVPSATLIPHLQPLLDGSIALDDINLVKPVIDIHLFSIVSPEEKKASFPNLDISKIMLTQPKIIFTKGIEKDIFSYVWNGELKNSNFLQIIQLHSNAEGITVKNMGFDLSDFIFTSPKGKIFRTREGKVAAQLTDLSLEQKSNLPLVWKATVSNAKAKDFLLDSFGKAKGQMAINNIELKELAVGSATIRDLQKLVAANTAFQIKKLSGYYSDANKEFRWYNTGFNRNNNQLTLDSFSFGPVLNKDSFLAKQTFQTDYIKLKTGAVSIGPFDIDSYIKDGTVNAGLVSIDNALMTDYKEKSLPFKTGIIKPLPANALTKIPFQLSIDMLKFTNAEVEYSEKSEKTKATGNITVTRLSAQAFPVKNYNLTKKDSLQIQATGYLMDTVWTRLKIKQSYTDSLGGFLMTASMKPADATVFNPALIPLASVKLLSGLLDTLNMRAIGQEYLSWGEMKMFYHDLKILILRNGDETKKAGLLNFLANNFVIRKKNTSHTGNVFFIRDRERSAINYIVKIVMSGIISSAGVKSNKKLMRKYKKELKQDNLPPIDFD